MTDKPKKPKKSRRTPVAGTPPPPPPEMGSDPMTGQDRTEPPARAQSPAIDKPPVIAIDKPVGPAEERITGEIAPIRASSPALASDVYSAEAPDAPVRRPRAQSVKPPDDLPSPEWPLDPSDELPASPVIPPTPPSPPQVTLPDPKAAAFEAARIVGEIVGDVESAGGAAIVAAAAAGAAIEAVRARARAAAEGNEVLTAPDPNMDTPPADNPGDPQTTVRMAREQILRALAADVAAQAEEKSSPPSGEAPGAPRSPSQPPPIPRAPSQPQSRPSSQAIPRVPGAPAPETGAPAADAPPADEQADDELDPVQIAAAAIARLRQRARTDLAELRTQYHRHDIFVLLLAFVMIVVAGRVHKAMVTPPNATFTEHGLSFDHSKAWLQPEPVPAYSPRIVHDLGGPPAKPGTLYHVEFTSSLDPSARLEVLIDKKPAWSNIVTGLELDRRTRWGELYTLDDSSVKDVAGHDWLRTAFRYAHVAEKGDVPRVDAAIEYATIDRDQIYVITLYGTPAELDDFEAIIAPSLRVPTQTGLPLVPQTRTLADRNYPNAVARAFDSTVMVVAADLVDGRLRPKGGGSGVVVGADGSILTNYHVIHDKDGRLHDVFVIGRFSQPDHAPQLWCAGRPSRSKLQRDLDLALIKCDLDLDGRAWSPTNGTVWATLPEARSADVRMGQRLWVLGYPDVGGGGLTLGEGLVEGWTGEDGTTGKDFIKTDASITHGNSGGPVVDDHGRLVGIAAAFRTRVTPTGNIVETSQVGLVRPLSTASCLLAIATVGWTPRENHTDCELEPSAVEAPAEGIRISSRVVDAANEGPVRDALVMILRPGVASSAVDVNRLDDQVLAWGRSNAQGEVQLKQPVPVPGTYSVLVVAKQYEPLVGAGELHLDANTPQFFDPWGKIWLRSR